MFPESVTTAVFAVLYDSEEKFQTRFFEPQRPHYFRTSFWKIYIYKLLRIRSTYSFVFL